MRRARERSGLERHFGAGPLRERGRQARLDQLLRRGAEPGVGGEIARADEQRGKRLSGSACLDRAARRRQPRPLGKPEIAGDLDQNGETAAVRQLALLFRR